MVPEELLIEYYFENPEACPFKIPENTNLGRLLDLKDDFLRGLKKKAVKVKPDPYVIIEGEVNIGEGRTIEPFVLIQGPAYIGKNCIINSGAVIREGTVLGDDVIIGHSAEIRNSLVMNEAKIQVHTVFEDSVAGRGARMGSGAITANRRFDQGDIELIIGPHRLSTGRDKFGCIIGDFTRVGANATTSPGIAIGKYSWIYPNGLIRESVPKETLVKLRQHQKSEHKERTELKSTDKEGKVT